MILTEQIKSDIKKYAIESYPNEIGGLILNVNKNILFKKCGNISLYPKINYVLNPLDYICASEIGDIVGFVHSHIGKGTSFKDYITSINHNIYSIIYSIDYNKFYIIEPKLKDYLNKEFKLGEDDCFSLVRNYYKNQLNINLFNYYRDKNWYKNNPNLILESSEKEGFINIQLKDIKENDLIVFNINNKSEHLGIYLGNNFILHHPRNNTSIINELTDSLKRRIKYILRHKSL